MALFNKSSDESTQKSDRSFSDKRDVEKNKSERESRSSESKSEVALIIFKTLHMIFCISILLVSAGLIAISSLAVSLFKESIVGMILLLILGVFMLFFSVVGIVGGLRKSKDLGWVIAVGFALLLVLHVFLIIKSEDFNVSNFVSSHSSNWGAMDNSERSNVQNQFNCCGYYNQVDRPGVPCPASNKGSCSSVLSDAAKQYISYSQAIYIFTITMEGLAIFTSLIISYVL